MKKVKPEAAAQCRPAKSERKNRVFSAKRQAGWFEMRSISNENALRGKISRGRELLGLLGGFLGLGI